MNTQYAFMLKRVGQTILPPDLALALILISSNYPCLEHIFMVPKVCELLMFYCISHMAANKKRQFISVPEGLRHLAILLSTDHNHIKHQQSLIKNSNSKFVT